MFRIATCFCFLVTSVVADEWPGFRGATGSGVSSEKDLPTSWAQDKGVLWSVDLPGKGNSSPVVTARRIDLTTQTEDGSLFLISIDRRTGQITRELNLGSGKLAAKGPANLYAHRHNAATPTVVADSDHTWAFFGTGLLVCVRASDGEIVWQKDLVKEYGAYDITFGMGSSPRMAGDNIIVSCLTKGPSYVVALNKSTGKEIWKHDRLFHAADDGPDAYTTPTIYESNNGTSLLISGSDHVDARLLSSGKQTWSAAGLRIDSPYGRVIASPIGTRNGIVVATSANPAGAGKGRVIGVEFRKGSKQLWSVETSSPDSSSPVILDNLVYMIADNGIATCVDCNTGDVKWKKRLSNGGGPYHASLVAGAGKVYFLNTDGLCTVIEHGGAGNMLSKNTLEGTFYATPALSDGLIYLRAYERLYAIDGR